MCRSSSGSNFLIDREKEAPQATWCYGPGWKLQFQRRSQNCEKRLLASSRLFVRAHRTNRLPLARFSYIWVLFENVLRKFNFHSNRSRITGTLHEDQYTFMIISRSILIRMRNVSDKVSTETKTHILGSITFFFASYRLWDNMEKYARAGQARDDSKAHALCMLDTSDYKHTLRICNTYWFSTATMVALCSVIRTLYL